MDSLFQDIRYGIRALRKNPGFTAIAVLTLALGIGMNTSIFSMVNGILLRPLGFPSPERLVTVWENLELRGGPRTEWTGRTTFADWRGRNRTFEGMAAVTEWEPNLTGSDRPEVLAAALVSPGYFSVLGIRPVEGRAFLPEEETPGNDQVAILGHGLWIGRFGGDPEMVGKTLILNGTSHTVIGVLPPGFRAPIVSEAQIFAPLPIDRARDDRGNYFLRVIGRLSDGVSREAALADMNRVAEGIALENPVDYRDVGVSLVSLQQTVVGTVRTPLLVLLGAVGLILLIACANVANLLLARASVRERELAVRTALGAGRSRLVRQLMTESVVLAMVAGALGLGLGIWGTDLLVRLTPPGLPRVSEIGLHPTVFLFALLASVGTGLLFGLAPALTLSGKRSSVTLRDGERGSSAGRGGRLRGGLVVVELAMGMALLVGAGLLLKSFAELQAVNPGFRVENSLSARLNLPATRFPGRIELNTFVDRLEDRLEAVPGVQAVGMVTVLPLSGLVHDISFGVEGRMPAPGEEPAADSRRATPGFFRAIGIPLIRGRLFEDSDRDGGERVALISESLARQHFASQDPIGQRIKVGGVRNPESPWWTIVGVVGSVRSRALDRIPEPEIYLPLSQAPARGVSFVLRADGDPTILAPAVREAVWSVDSDMPLAQLATLEAIFAFNVAPQRFLSWLIGAFAALALLLGTVGIYGVMAFMVSQQTREIGIRMALGASPPDLLKAVMVRGAVLTIGGLALGLAGAAAASGALSSLLFEVSPLDPATLASVSFVLATAALFACYWPARRATRVDPLVALRYE